MLDTVFLGTDTPVILDGEFLGDFEELGFLNFTSISVSIGGEEYTSLANPTNVVIVNESQLSIIVGDVTQLDPGRYPMVIKGYSDYYNDGIVLKSSNYRILKVKVARLPS